MQNAQYHTALRHLRTMLGDHAQFRDGQYEAIEKVAFEKKRALIVQATGWGKSIVYFISTKILREQGKGITLVISPLISLMRNQIEMARKLGIEAYTINSSQSSDEWEKAISSIQKNRGDILFISPERLANQKFQKELWNLSVGLLVIDEAHCISDWGHDFRPDYRRIVHILKYLPPNVPVLATTATANDRVVKEIQEQLGEDLLILRGGLARNSLYLQNIILRDQSERLAWLAEVIPQLPGSGIVYCLTKPDTERVARWLNDKGISAKVYHSESDDRESLEQELLQNKVKVLVATVALGMGFDKPDLGFVIHYQCPGSAVAYYQQIGRAGRAIENAYCILLSGEEDREIQDYFISSALPDFSTFEKVYEVISESESVNDVDIQKRVNDTGKAINQVLKILEIEGYISKFNGTYHTTDKPFSNDKERIIQINQLRRIEQKQMEAYLYHKGCLMEFLQKSLDDPTAQPCGHCMNCAPQGKLPTSVPSLTIHQAQEFLKKDFFTIEPRKQFPNREYIEKEYRIETGYTLCHYGDAGWGKLVKEGKYIRGQFSDELVEVSVELIKQIWNPDPFPQWVTAIPSRRHPLLVPDFARRLAHQLGIPYYEVLERIADAPPQKDMKNNYQQADNVRKTIKINRESLQKLNGQILRQPVLLVDDILDSGWTLTIAGYLLRKSGTGKVYPFTLAKATNKNA